MRVVIAGAGFGGLELATLLSEGAPDAVDVVLITAISTVGAVVYNLVTHLGGGIEVTLKETE